MAEIGEAHCNCADVCPGYAHCAAIWIPDEQICHGYCSDVTLATVKPEDAVVARVGLASRINLEMCDASLGEVASLIARIADARIYVPADRMEERRTLSLDEVSLEAAVRELGLMALVQS